jgi:formate/nitrite transporter FocA (FNT family)
VLLDRAWGDSAIVAGENLTWGRFISHNLVPSTLGNVVGGALLVGSVYWFVYLRSRPRSDDTTST